MALQSDSMGFLRGVPQDMGDMKRIWRNIQTDIKAIRAALDVGDGVAQIAHRSASPAATRAPSAAAPAARAKEGKASQEVAAPAVRNTMPSSMVKTMVSQAAAVGVAAAVQGRNAAAAAATPQRDRGGRFVGSSGSGGDGPEVDAKSMGAISSGFGRIKDALSELKPEDEVDPGIKAMTEVAQPMAALRLVERAADPALNQHVEMARPAPSVVTVPSNGGAEKPVPVILRVPALPQMGGTAGNASRREPGDAPTVARAAAELRAARPATMHAPVEPARRDGRGRFVKGDVAGQPKPERVPSSVPRGEGDGEPDESVVRSISERIAGAVKEAGSGLEDSDPAAKAMTEVAQPVARGYKALFGGVESKEEKRRERWYRRFWSHMRRTDESQAKDSKAMRKSLKNLEEKPVATAGNGGLLSGLGSAMGGALGAGGGLLKMMGRGAGSMLKRLPLVGGLLASIGGLYEAWESESSGLSREEKDRKTGKAVGGLGGALAGGFAGAKLGAALGVLAGPIGAAIGGVVGGAAGLFFGEEAGKVIGNTVGGWVTSLREADIPGKIAAGWDSVTTSMSSAGDWIKDKAGAAFDLMKDGWDVAIKPLMDLADSAKEMFSGFADAMNSFFKDKFGVDLKAGFQQAIQSVSEAKDQAAAMAKSAAQTVSDGAAKVMNKASELASAAGEKAVKAGEYVQENTLVGKGATLMAASVKNLFGNPRKDALLAEMDAQGITDKNERAMLLAQVDHESNGFRASEESFNYRSAERIAAVSKSAAKKGLPAIEAAMKQGPEAVAELMYGGRMGNKDPGDGFKYRGRGNLQITGRDNYRALGQKLGLDLESNPDLLLDPEIAAKASVQWWKDNKVGNAARAGDVTKATKIINGGTNGLAHRQELYAQYLNNPIVAAPPAATAAVAQASPVASPAIATAAVPTAGAAPKVPVQVASADTGAGRGFVNPSLAEPGQDLQDRKLAHLVTGGIAT